MGKASVRAPPRRCNPNGTVLQFRLKQNRTLKAWLALILPEAGRWKDKHQAEKQTVLTMEFKTFVNAFIRVPCQIVRQGRRIVYRLLAWNP